jgi:hypothetical protein
MEPGWQPKVLSTYGNTQTTPALDSLSLVSHRLLRDKGAEFPIYASNARLYEDRHDAPRQDQKRKSKLDAESRITAPRLEKEAVGYQQYRIRQRRDAGNDGESVWPDELEEAFQEGMF